jgi:ComF family protein
MRYILDLIFPARCPFCSEFSPKRAVCEDCLASLNFLPGGFSALHLEKTWFGQARSVMAYEGQVVEALQALKYERRFDLVEIFDRYLAEEIKKERIKYDLLIPVPLHWRRLFYRGYNQSALLVKALSRRLGIKDDLSILKRVKNIVPQVQLKREERLKNVKGAFLLNKKRAANLVGKTVLLVDDVLTTGATINECAKVLVKNGKCGKVNVLTVARTV